MVKKVLDIPKLGPNFDNYRLYKARNVSATDAFIYTLLFGKLCTLLYVMYCDALRYHSLEDAREQFEQIYEERTGNYFGEKKFVKYPGKYYKMDIDYGEEEEVRKLTENQIKSNLATPVQDLIKLIFDVNMMKQMMLEFGKLNFQNSYF